MDQSGLSHPLSIFETPLAGSSGTFPMDERKPHIQSPFETFVFVSDCKVPRAWYLKEDA